MNEKSPVKSPHYFMMMDEKRNSIMSILFTISTNNPVMNNVFEAACSQFGVSKEELADFLKDWGNKEHELGWCRDPDCKLNKKETL